ncbi:type II toxin-antitoxin system RelE/ParE family toxin [Paenibacillus tyrfis]|uniref:type II toxin-antitoxin system RelE/ParE family toxin n=1 Tax=Paenibacillus tyrfis TaxID=1501230 RepID=UPI002852A487|nr:type II toxin-antitoxin system RelE/ParE family toxin [Paenibacillus tyrfis]
MPCEGCVRLWTIPIKRENIFMRQWGWTKQLMEKLNREIGGLADFLHMGSVLSEDDYTLIQRGYRFIVVSPYLIFYRIINNEVIIHRILHGRRDYLRELF